MSLRKHPSHFLSFKFEYSTSRFCFLLSFLFLPSFNLCLEGTHVDGSLSYGWKLALVAISMLPVLVVLGFFQVKLMDHLQDHLRDAYGSSAALVCEQIASIRTVASLRRENAILAEFQYSINVPVRRAMISTIKSTTVSSIPTDFLILDICFQSICSTVY